MASTISDSATMSCKGIGLEICRQLASNRVMVVLTARDEKRGLEAVAKLHESSLSNVSNAGVSGAIVDWEAIKTLKLEDGKNNTNVAELLNKASKQTYGLAEECVKTNCYGTKGVTEALLRCLLLSNSGRIVNVSGGLGKLQVCKCNCTFTGK
ncbi:salutaridine reductase [Vitis vinifera]|uniref:salutaridine reductase n=1 Tax=Vitis vinifera TaxID=29760 RepID=UPI002882FACE|nr:salutaridine reductase [Vitis vinifera]